jgi:hypothetical protein
MPNVITGPAEMRATRSRESPARATEVIEAASQAIPACRVPVLDVLPSPVLIREGGKTHR